MDTIKGPAGGPGPGNYVQPDPGREDDALSRDEMVVRAVEDHAISTINNLRSMEAIQHRVNDSIVQLAPMAQRVLGSEGQRAPGGGPSSTPISSEGLPWYKKEPVQLRSNLAGVVSAITLLVGLNISNEYASVLLDVLVVVIPIAGGWIAGLSARDKVVPVAKLENVTEQPKELR